MSCSFQYTYSSYCTPSPFSDIGDFISKTKNNTCELYEIVNYSDNLSLVVHKFCQKMSLHHTSAGIMHKSLTL